MKISSVTHQGFIRENNEDRLLARRYDNGGVLLAVADGMGGHVAGEEAARIAVKTMEEFDADSKAAKEQLLELILSSNRSIHNAVAQKPALQGMGTTLTAVFLKDETASWAHIGDTRLYLLRQGRLNRLTDDHTLTGLLLKEGRITEAQARLHPMRTMLLQCIGCESHRVDTGSFELREGDLILLSSDGLHDMVSEKTIESILSERADSGLKERLNKLVTEALNTGGRDNITAVAAEL